MRPTSPILMSATFLCLAAGCGEKNVRVPLFPVAGQVLVDGKATGGVQVRFIPADAVNDLDALKPTAVSGEDGGFRLGTYGRGDGAPEGRYKVTLFLPDVVPNGSNSPADLLGGRYIEPGRTRLEATVVRGENRLDPFQATKASGTARPRPAPTKPNHDGVG